MRKKNIPPQSLQYRAFAQRTNTIWPFPRPGSPKVLADRCLSLIALSSPWGGGRGFVWIYLFFTRGALECPFRPLAFLTGLCCQAPALVGGTWPGSDPPAFRCHSPGFFLLTLITLNCNQGDQPSHFASLILVLC